jgi:hypothetical protein
VATLIVPDPGLAPGTYQIGGSAPPPGSVMLNPDTVQLLLRDLQTAANQQRKK